MATTAGNARKLFYKICFDDLAGDADGDEDSEKEEALLSLLGQARKCIMWKRFPLQLPDYKAMR